MDIIHLQYFVKAAELQHFTKAAQELNITQPTLSAAIRKLESEFRTPLFEAKGRNVFLTTEGKILKKYAESILELLGEAQKELDDLRDLHNNHVSIICPAQVINYKIAQEILAQNPNITISYKPKFDPSTTELLENGDIDIYVSTPPYQGPGYTFIPLRKDPLLAVLPINHPLADERTLSLSKLADQPFISYPSSELRDTIDSFCHESGFTPKVICETPNFHEMLPMIAHGNLAALIPEVACSNIHFYRDIQNLIVMIPLEGSPSDLMMGLSYLSGKPLRNAVKITINSFVSTYSNNQKFFDV